MFILFSMYFYIMKENSGITKVIWPDGRVMRVGLIGIMELLSVSRSTAYKYKNTILKDAVIQEGHMIWIDEEKVIRIMDSNRKSHNHKKENH